MTPIAFAKTLRAAQTDTEATIWQHLRERRLGEAKFKRQQPLGKYVVDFVCFERRLIVELDGGQHNGSAHDEVRDDWLRAQGFVVERLWNNEVRQNLPGVLTRILERLAAQPSPSLSLPPPRWGREASPPSVRALSALPKSPRSKASLPERERGGSEGVATRANIPTGRQKN